MQYRCNIARIYKSNVYGSGARNGGAIPQTVSITHYEKRGERGIGKIAAATILLSHAKKFAARRISPVGLLTLDRYYDVVENPGAKYVSQSIGKI